MTAAGQTWSGTHTFQAPSYTDAVSVSQVRDLVSRSERVHAVGTRHSFSDIADTDGMLVSLTSIPFSPLLDAEARTVTVGAGTRYGELAPWLDARGWALHNMGSLPHISIGGAMSTGTHGSGNANGVLATSVRSIEFVTASGRIDTVSRGEPEFSGLVIGLGAFGIVLRVTLDIEPAFQVRQDVFEGLRWDDLLDDPRAVMGAAYSVSVFTDWGPETVGPVWWKTRLGGSDAEVVPDSWRGAERLRSSRSALAGEIDDNLTLQGGVPGAWFERLPHFRVDSTPSSGDELQSEYFVDMVDAAPALQAVRRLADRITPHLIVSEFRTIAADDLWLSGAYGRDTFAIHFTWKNHLRAVRDLLPDVEAALAPFGARPHWGKVHTMDASGIAGVVPELARARDLFDSLDPHDAFVNAHLVRLGVRS